MLFTQPQNADSHIEVGLDVEQNGTTTHIKGSGNGRLDSIANALRMHLNMDFEILDYSEHGLKKGSDSKAVSFVQIESNGKKCFGVGIDSDIIAASVFGLVSALNRII